VERASESAEERVYDVVRTVEEIPAARSPRVIKLHGSFPSNMPFVFTEEDFRIYPTRAGAFVNLAQQVAMENTLVLLGFSGDDPNFLFWSGWVRDRLGAKAPLIYLVGVLNLTAPKRKMLEARGIQPIDLLHHPKLAEWPEGQRMSNAHQWFLERLRSAEPYQQRRWPRPAAGFVPPLAFVTATTDPYAPSPNPELPGEPPSVDTFRELVAQWRQNRSVYPDWIVPPITTSKLLWTRISPHLPHVNNWLRKLPEEERLAALFELNWQLETALIPLSLFGAEQVIALLEAPDLRYSELPSQLASCFRALVLAVIRHAREENDRELFTRWADWLESRLGDEPGLSDRLHYERCLERRAEFDVDRLEALLEGWSIVGDSFWSLRKAALLSDLGRDAAASELSAQVLLTIREQTLRGQKDIAAWSRESFTMLFRGSVVQADFGKWLENQPVRDRFDLRQELLQARGCPGREDFFFLVQQLSQEPPYLRRRLEKKQDFDLGAVSSTLNFVMSDPRIDRLLAYQALRFQEESGLPIRTGNTNLAGQILTGAANWLMDVAPSRAIDALMQVLPAGADKTIETLLTRNVVAKIGVKEAQHLFDRTQRLMAAAKKRVEKRGDDNQFWVDRLKAACEIASRIVLRVPAGAPQLVAAVIDFHRNSRLSQRNHLGDILPRLVERSLEAANSEERNALLLLLFEQPIPADDKHGPYDRPDLTKRVPKNLTVIQSSSEWDVVVKQTIAGLKDANTRRTASTRLNWLWNAKLVGKVHYDALASALWLPEHLEQGLPGGTVFSPVAFLMFPSPHSNESVVDVIMSMVDDEPTKEADKLDANSTTIVHEPRGKLDPDSQKKEIERLASNQKNPPPKTGLADLLHDLTVLLQQPKVKLDAGRLNKEIERLRTFVINHPAKRGGQILFGDPFASVEVKTACLTAALSKRVIDIPEAKDSLEALISNQRYPLRLEPALPTLVQLGLVAPADAVEKIKRLFQTQGDAIALLDALFDQYIGGASGGALVDDVFWHQVIYTVAMRRAPTLIETLRFLAWMMCHYPTRVPTTEDELLSAGLDSILFETELDMNNGDLRYDPFLVRYFAAWLVTAMERAKRGDPSTHAAWASAIAADHLPDTRRARDLVLASE
ncbi:SIR2 family protein, partial (plasmid) [Acetobacter orientalis]|uniref:SIR2 family protein n=1 Tax=Acetobacter orientalis TaxID=146474 RepID=UPI003864B9FE